MKIRVPATSANIGPGFDSVGVALSKYLTVEILEPSPEWFVEHDLGEDIPSDQNNLLLKTALRVTGDLPPHHLKMTSDIPLARGLGSSSSVIVAGIELANQLGQLELTDDEKLGYATEIEGHPDNVSPALLGNLVIASYVNGHLETVKTSFPECDVVAFIPDYELKTSDSRRVLPKTFDYGHAVDASAIANVAIAALLTGDLRTAGRAISSDLYHQPYRQSLVREFDIVKQEGMLSDAYATYLSGAGPTVMTLLPKGKASQFIERLNRHGLSGEIVALTVDTQGLIVLD